MELKEIAPGVNLEKDILAQMDFQPAIKSKPALMDLRIFRTEPMNLKPDLLNIPLHDRLIYDPKENMFFVNFEGFAVRSRETIQQVEQSVADILTPLNRKVYTIVNYDNFEIRPELVDEYTEMVSRLVARFYSKVTRYTTSAFLRMKIGDALKNRGVAPHIYESQQEARAVLVDR